MIRCVALHEPPLTEDAEAEGHADTPKVLMISICELLMANSTWCQAQGLRCICCGKHGECCRQRCGTKDLRRMALHKPALAEDAEAERKNDHSQEAHEQVSCTHVSLPLHGKQPLCFVIKPVDSAPMKILVMPCFMHLRWPMMQNSNY